VVAHQRNADAIGDFAIQKVIGKAAQVGAAETGTGGIESSGIGCREPDEMPQFLLEFVTQHR